MAVRKKGLGRGVDALIPSSKPKKDNKSKDDSNVKIVEKEVIKEVPVEKEVIKEVIKEVKVPADTMLPISDIEPNRDQPRKFFDQEALEELADSISQYGLIQPIVVQKENDYYKIIAGERRWRAAKLAGIKEVPVVVKNMGKQEASEVALIENLQRKDLNPIEEARAYKSLIDEYNLKQEEVASRLSKSRSAITNTLRLLNLTDKVQNMVIEGQISNGHARALLALELPEIQERAAKSVVEKNMSVRETEEYVKSILHPKQKKLPLPKQNDAEVVRLTEKLKNILGTKVSINHKKDGKGKIEIDYYSTDEFERLFALFESLNRD